MRAEPLQGCSVGACSDESLERAAEPPSAILCDLCGWLFVNHETDLTTRPRTDLTAEDAEDAEENHAQRE